MTTPKLIHPVKPNLHTWFDRKAQQSKPPPQKSHHQITEPADRTDKPYHTTACSNRRKQYAHNECQYSPCHCHNKCRIQQRDSAE